MIGPPVLIDRRVGSNDLYAPLMARKVPVELVTLRSGDAAFIGEGHDGPALIGVERKRLNDLWHSLVDGRLAGQQLTGLIADYQYRWLVVEGQYREREDGLVEIPQGGGWRQLQARVQDLEAWLLTLQLRGGLLLWRSYNQTDTVRFLACLHQWWSKPWEDHHGHLALYTPPDAVLLTKPNLIRRVANELPGIGYKKSDLVARKFHTVHDMVNAEAHEWLTIPGIGPTISNRILLAIHKGVE